MTDAIADAPHITDVPAGSTINVTFDTNNATDTTGEPSGSGPNAVWLKYTGTEATHLYVDSQLGAGGSNVGVYRETSPGVLAAACDSYCPVVQDTYYSTSRVVMEEGQTIWIKVSTGTKAKSGTLKFTVPARPSNDYLAGRTVLRPLGWGETETRPFTVVGATRSTDEPGAMSQPAMGPVGRASTVVSGPTNACNAASRFFGPM